MKIWTKVVDFVSKAFIDQAKNILSFSIHSISSAIVSTSCKKAHLHITYFFFAFQCSDALQSSPLTEAAELLDLLNHIELEGLLFAHDKLAERQVSQFPEVGEYSSADGI